MYLSALINGSLLGGALIIAIGAQNMFVIKQGLARDRVLVVVLISSIVDATLIALGALGLGSLIAAFPLAITIATIGGSAFLLVYGTMSLYRAAKPQQSQSFSDVKSTSSLKRAALMTLAFSLLNPHVYLDTVILLGGIASSYPFDERLYFLSGAIATSFVWFFTIGFGATALAPFMKHPAGARVLDLLVAIMMFIVAAGLISDFLSQS
ncbi:LysE/ArgO family amino acid transporter [Sneathiella glossodoripedis]|uniref:LysE/ArgO family amino acid transporter n=1 Tax=Sneathiella glossodoripedis TaxID=418853 RepID=UPI000562FCA0|nr:LysE family transporter [Sneathiella glossodoripedis]